MDYTTLFQSEEGRWVLKILLMWGIKKQGKGIKSNKNKPSKSDDFC